jgi:mono/diheme cytochrome c family protein
MRLCPVVLLLLCAGCGWEPGRPVGIDVPRPEQVLDFAALYKENCAACHGANGKNGAALSLANPVYLAVAGETNLRTVIAKGVPGSLMPPSAKTAGGMLTDQQINVIVQGMIKNWGGGTITAPAYASSTTGDATAGKLGFKTFCARCHGADGKGLIDPSYLALVSDQSLRSWIIAGQPDEGMPDWRSDAAKPMTDPEITNVVAWLAANRKR